MGKETNASRLQQLLEYYSDEPDDPFIIYGLAMEYWKTDRQKSRYFFEILLHKHSDYLATYYQAGHLYEELDEEVLAREVYKKGIVLAIKQQNTTTERELKNALDELDFS